MKYASGFVVALALLFSCTLVRADQSAVWKYVDGPTFAVIRLDLTRSDYKAAVEWVVDVLKKHNAGEENIAPLAEDMENAPAKQMLAQMQQAGAKELYGVLTLSDFPSDAGWVVIPIPAGANGEKIARALVSEQAKQDEKTPNQVRLVDGNWVSAVVGDVVFYGRPASLERISHAAPVARPDLVKALQDAGDAPLVMGLAPSDDTRKVVEQMMPNLPPPVAMPSTVLTHGLRSASFAVGLPPKPSLDVKIQSESPAAAKDLSTLITAALNIARQDKGFQQEIPDGGKIIDAVTPKVDGDHLTVAVDATMVDQLAGVIAGTLGKARDRAMRVASMSNLRQLDLCVMMYRNEHKDTWPATLADVAKYADKGGFEKITKNPRWPEKKDPYVYVKPNVEDAKMDWSSHLLIYEAFDQWPGFVSVAFADGHVEGIGSEARFRKLLGEAKSGVGEGL